MDNEEEIFAPALVDFKMNSVILAMECTMIIISIMDTIFTQLLYLLNLILLGVNSGKKGKLADNIISNVF